ncbi:zf-HC2 domain-containing protein [Stigmatella sp. ncwal1]|uniref:Zf-HC2 domain-containing protein n=1 Tax=Stigmatella ashevillensis TaxID=2995309 RepID=A0ABT5DH61_9BACT|nr:zf-HC2 domain-containing protein [Stigmatella ashevillena]MDC0712958.1 zf-HC2 domain-containing protein [Stigmatella ashevillena]
MAGNPACERFIPFLSPYIDGELTPAERVNVERHLSACKECMGRTADFRAESGLLRVGLDMAVDDVDFKDFTQKVMARITPEKPPLLERLKLSLSEMFLYQRTAMVSSLATAAVLTLVAVPLLMRNRAPEGYGAERMTVQRVSTYEPSRVAPVVMETDNGGAIIWLVDQDTPENLSGQDEDSASGQGLERDAPRQDDAPRPKNPAAPPDTQGGSL